MALRAAGHEEPNPDARSRNEHQKAGADAFVSKADGPQELLAALRGLMREESERLA